MPGMKIPMINETFNTRVKSWVIPPRFYAVNQLAEIFAWQLRIKGLPIPAMTWPTMTQAKEWFTNILVQVPKRHNALPNAIPSFEP